MTRLGNPRFSTTCPTDLCIFSECHCSPSEAGRATAWTFRLLGIAAVGIAFAGVLLPVLPTTPFLLIAAWAFAGSSPSLDAWLRAHPHLGRPLAAWEDRRAIPRRAKALAGVSMSASWLLLWSGGAPVGISVAAGAVMLAAGVWILTRPS